MSAATKSSLPYSDVIPGELEADTQAILNKLISGNPLDPETHRRIRDEADRIRDDVFRKHGVLEIGVSAIRELRDGN